MVTPKPLCNCRVCKEARQKGPPYERTGPSAFIHDENILIDTPAEVAVQLNRSAVPSVDYLMFTHLDPDHVEGFRIVEQISLDFRTWEAYPEKQIRLVLPVSMMERLKNIRTIYGPLINYYVDQGFVKCVPFKSSIDIGDVEITAIPVQRRHQTSYVYVFKKHDRKIVYAPCDIKPFPEEREETWNADLLVIQPGIFEEGLKHGFKFPNDHISRTTLYTFEETLALAGRIQAKQILFVHIEEYWNRSYADYFALQNKFDNVLFSFDGMNLTI